MLKHKILGTLAGMTSILMFGSLAAADATTEAKKVNEAPMSAADKEEMVKLSEAFGHFIGRNLHTPGMNFDLEAIIKGMREGSAGKPAPMSDQDYEALLTKVQEKAFKELAAANLKAADNFIKENKAKENVKEIEPGKLQFIIIKEGQGTIVGEHNAPLIHYAGTYIDGTPFSSSEEAGGPITIPLDQTIPGFSKGILGMKEGEKRRLFVHPYLGYGTTGQLPPNSLLIFDIEVIKADNKDQSANALQTADDDDFDDDEDPS